MSEKFGYSRADRLRLWERDGRTCQLCRQPLAFEAMQADHITPKSFGGQRVWSNMQAVHGLCNRRKSVGSIETGSNHPYLTTGQFARLAGLTPGKVQWMIYRGDIPHERGRGAGSAHIRIPESALAKRRMLADAAPQEVRPDE